MAFFKMGKKKGQSSDISAPSLETASHAQGSPVEQVLMMKQQGYTDNQIVQTLQSQGYNASQISDAINQAGLSGSLQAMPQNENFDTGMSDYGQSYDPQQQSFQSFQTPIEVQSPATIDEERMQEVAEAVVEEKWEELAKDIRKVVEWKERSDERLAKLEQQIIDIRLSIDTLTKGMMSKISTYDQNIVDVGVEIKAMEKVFQKILPNLTENVNKLDRMTKGYKEPEKK